MCYDISFTTNLNSLEDDFPDLIYDDQIRMNFTLAEHIMGHDYGLHPIIYRNKQDGKLHCKLMEWGVIPHDTQDIEAFTRDKRARMLNARSEKFLDDPNSYWFEIKARRCLIPVSGIYENHEAKGFPHKIPYFIRLKNSPLFYLPGLYAGVDVINKGTGETEKLYTFTMGTRKANAVMRAIHNAKKEGQRMVMFMELERAKHWLDNLTIQEYREMINFAMPSSELEYWTVRRLRTREALTRNDGTHKYDPYIWEGQPDLVIEGED